MREKTIRKVLKEKSNKWLESIKDKDLREKVREEAIITGGAINSLLMDTKVNDYDIYLRNVDSVKGVCEYYLEEAKKNNLINIPDNTSVILEDNRVSIKNKSLEEDGEEIYNDLLFVDGLPKEKLEEIKGTYQPIYITSNAITLSDGIQLMIRFFGDVGTIHSNFDFVHCMNYYDIIEDKLNFNKESLISFITKELIYCGSKYPISSIIRTRKFIKRGYYVSAGQYLKMLYQVSKLDLNNEEVLRDQLVGVDVAYFNDVLKKLREINRDGKMIDYTYFGEIIDEIF